MALLQLQGTHVEQQGKPLGLLAEFCAGYNRTPKNLKLIWNTNVFD